MTDPIKSDAETAEIDLCSAVDDWIASMGPAPDPEADAAYQREFDRIASEALAAMPEDACGHA